jgi:hypothetical protein
MPFAPPAPITLAAYWHWREAEALVSNGASPIHASAPLREARAVAARIGAKPLLRELELLAERARLDLAPTETDGANGAADALGLTRRKRRSSRWLRTTPTERSPNRS